MSVVPGMIGGRRGGGGSSTFDPFSLDIWDPLGFDQGQGAALRMDWKETPEAHVIKADLPGLRKDEVKVEVEDGRVLQISGERTREKEEEDGDKWHRVERTSGKFLRRFRLPEDAKMDEVKANMEHGVLTVVVPKQEEKKTLLKPVHIAG